MICVPIAWNNSHIVNCSQHQSCIVSVAAAIEPTSHMYKLRTQAGLDYKHSMSSLLVCNIFTFQPPD